MEDLIVQKYGGSSLSSAEKIKSVAKRIGKAKDGGNSLVVVVSAMGDTTDDLLYQAATITDKPGQRELALLLSTGELVSCSMLTMALHHLGYNAVSLNGSQAGIYTDSDYNQARIIDIKTERLLRELDAGNIVVVAGFQGVSDNMDVTTLGRGGSDTTAVALAASLEANVCEIFTDVDGIYTADPRVVPEARVMGEIGYEEMMELASHGAKMHPRSIELGAVYNVPIRVTSSFLETKGTLIC